MSETRPASIEQRLSDISDQEIKQDFAWLIENIKKLEAENKHLKGEIEWLKKELAYSEFQGEVGF